MRFKTFKTHQTDVKTPYSAGLLVARTDLKLSKYQIHGKLLYSGGQEVVEQIQSFRNPSHSCEST